MVQSANYIGKGLYTPSEAAMYAGVHSKTFRRWAYGTEATQRLIAPELGDDDKVVTFIDLIESVTLRRLLVAPQDGYGVTIHKLRQVLQEASDQKITFPLARRHTLFRFGKRLVLKIGDDYIGAEKKNKGQFYQNQIIEPFLREVTYGDEPDGLAKRWSPLSGEGGFKVVLNPLHRFGQPYIEPGFILVDALANAAYAEGTEAKAARAFDTRIEAVELALKYRDDYLQRRTNAQN